MTAQEKVNFEKMVNIAAESQNINKEEKANFIKTCLQDCDEDNTEMKEPFNNSSLEVLWEAFSSADRDDIVNQIQYSINEFNQAIAAIEGLDL